mgnify:CR=1 FL=1
MKPTLILATGLILLAACAGGPGKAPVAPAPDVTVSGSLPSQDLAAGECGLFLWTQSEPRRFIYFSKAGSRTAETMLAETQQTLALTRLGGSLFGQFMTEMEYLSSENESIILEVSPGETMEGGQKISNGRIRILNAGGWETVIPVSGLRACQPDSE